MVYAAINEKGENYYTDMRRVFAALRNRQTEYNWLITDCECFCDPEIEKAFEKDYCWIGGEALTELVLSARIQWIWAVFSAFDPSVPLSDVLKYDLPQANGYPGFWKKPVSIQHSLAQMEIVPWDSCSTLLFSRKKEDVDAFLRFFPESERLETLLDRM